MRAWISVVAAGLLALGGASAAVADPAPEYFNLPTGYNAGTGIAPAPDGSVWFAANPSTPDPAIGRLITSQASPGTANGMATFPTPKLDMSCCANFVRSVAFDAANKRVWFVQSNGIVGFANPETVSPGTSAGIVDKLLTPASDLWDVAIGAGGLAWFSEESASNVAPAYAGDRIASVDAGLSVAESDNIALQGGLTSLDPTRYDAQPQGITTDPTGKPWFAESNPGYPGYRIATAHGTGYDEYLITPCAGAPCSGSNTGTGPTDVAVAHDGSIWFTNQLKNEVGRLDVSGGTFTNYSLPAIDAGLAGGQARAISVASDGTLWVAEFGGYSLPNANAIVKLVPSQPTPTATVWHLGAGKFPLAVAPDAKGDVWFSLATSQAPGLIGRLPGVIAGAGGGGTGGGGGSGGTPVKPASTGVARAGSPSTAGTTLTANQICVGPPEARCSLVFLISSQEYVTGFPGSHAFAAKKKRKPKPVILGTTTVTLHGGQHKLVKVKLNAKGRKLLKQKHKLKVFFTVTQKGAAGKPAKRIKATKVTFKVAVKKHRKHR